MKIEKPVLENDLEPIFKGIRKKIKGDKSTTRFIMTFNECTDHDETSRLNIEMSYSNN